MTPKKYPQNHHTQKNIEIQNFEPQKMGRAYVCVKISEYPPPLGSTAIVPKLRKIFWFPTYVRDDFNGLKWTGFLAESHLFAFNTLRIVYSVEKNTPIIDCITHLLLMTLHSERCLIGRYPIWFTDVFLFYQPSAEAISCVQKSKNHFKIWLRQTVTNARLSFSEKLNQIDHVLLKFA